MGGASHNQDPSARDEIEWFGVPAIVDLTISLCGIIQNLEGG